MTEDTTNTIGLDLGDKSIVICVLDADGEVIERSEIPTTKRGIERYFKQREPTRVVLELGTHSPWISRLLEELGHEVFVANSRRMKLISANHQKCDQVDAELLARLGRADPELLAPISHRRAETQADLAQIRARAALVESRTALINTARGLVKSQGERLPSCSADSFYKKAILAVPPELHDAVMPLLELIKKLTLEIRTCDKRIANLCETKYQDTAPLMQISGVGAITALCFVLTLESPERFDNARSVGPYIGLVPRRSQSGKSDPQLGISKVGDKYMRSLLVQCSHYIIGPHGPDTALKRWGLAIVEKGGKSPKQRAAIAVARKLTAIMYRLWVTGADYEPFPDGKPAEQEIA